MSNEKSSGLNRGEKSAQIKHRLQAKSAQNKYVAGFWCDRTTGDGLFHWRKCYYGLWTCILAGSNSLKLKTSWWICFLQTRSFCLHNILTDGLECCGLLVDYCDVFISCLDSHSDGTHSLQRIHLWASDEMLHFSKSDEETNSSTFWMAWEWVHFQQILIFGWTIPLTSMKHFHCKLFIVKKGSIDFWNLLFHPSNTSCCLQKFMYRQKELVEGQEIRVTVYFSVCLAHPLRNGPKLCAGHPESIWDLAAAQQTASGSGIPPADEGVERDRAAGEGRMSVRHSLLDFHPLFGAWMSNFSRGLRFQSEGGSGARGILTWCLKAKMKRNSSLTAL